MGGEQSSLIRTALPSAARRHKLSLSVLFVWLDVGGGGRGRGVNQPAIECCLSFTPSLNDSGGFRGVLGAGWGHPIVRWKSSLA